jgi:hypothetical protein
VSDRDLFVDSSGTSTTITAPTLGHVAYTCHDCGHRWEYGQESCSKCHGIVFDSVYVEPSLIQRLGNKIMGVAPAEKIKIEPLNADDVAVFERITTAGREFAAALQAGDARAREIVNSGRNSAAMSALQGRLNAVALPIGDFNSSNLTSSMAVPARGLAGFVNDMVAQHATEVNT